MHRIVAFGTTPRHLEVAIWDEMISHSLGRKTAEVPVRPRRIGAMMALAGQKRRLPSVGRARRDRNPQWTDRHFSRMGKKTGQIRLREKPSVSDLESSSLAGFFALIRSNLCTRS